MDGPENRVGKQNSSIEPQGSIRFSDEVDTDSTLINIVAGKILNDSLSATKEAMAASAQAMLSLIGEYERILNQQLKQAEASIVHLKAEENQQNIGLNTLTE